jgi:hypothetical protein
MNADKASFRSGIGWADRALRNIPMAKDILNKPHASPMEVKRAVAILEDLTTMGGQAELDPTLLGVLSKGAKYLTGASQISALGPEDIKRIKQELSNVESAAKTTLQRDFEFREAGHPAFTQHEKYAPLWANIKNVYGLKDTTAQSAVKPEKKPPIKGLASKPKKPKLTDEQVLKILIGGK